MSKKIIYLLSLLMALSLVFASCKKNSGLDPNNVGGGIQNEDNSGNTGENGLYQSYDDIPDLDKPIITYNVFTLNGTETYRNSIIVPMGADGSYLAVFSENRYDAVTSDNDIALDGETITDIVYNLSTKAGRDGSWIGKQVVGTTATSPKDSRAAIIVFKIADDKVVIVASQGAGISRVKTAYDDRKWSDGEVLKSNLQYIVGTLVDNKFNWSDWKNITLDGTTELYKKIEELGIQYPSKTDIVFKQFGTHSAKGVADGKKIYVPIVLAFQGTTSDPKELMGNIILTGDFNTETNPKWELATKEKAVLFNSISSYNNARSKQKESRIYSVSGSTVKYLTVPSGSADSADRYLFVGEAGNAQQPSATGIKAGDGSPGLVKVKWHGADRYDVANYKNTLAQADKILLMHVRDTESNLHINLINGTDLTAGTVAERSVLINQNGKASSIDVLPDGTIITLAEEGLASGSASQRKFNVIFKKYSQKYLNSILQ